MSKKTQNNSVMHTFRKLIDTNKRTKQQFSPELTHHGVGYHNKILYVHEMFLYWRNECHNLYNTDRLDAIELVAAAAAVVAAAAEMAVAAAAAAAAVPVVSKRWLNTKKEMKKTVSIFSVCTRTQSISMLFMLMMYD